MNIRCMKCKGSLECGRSFCAHYAKSEARFKVQQFVDKAEFQAEAPAPFVGHMGYPYVNVGVLSPGGQADDVWEYDAPRHWADSDYDIPRIIDFRSSLVNSRFKVGVKEQHKFLDISQEVGMASKPVDIEFKLEDRPKFRLKTDSYHAPMGPNAKLEKANVTSNPKVDRKVDKVVSDTDLKSREAILYLYDHNYDENFLTKILSVGNLGIGKNRKLVPTRWSITATDDMLAKNLHKEIMDYPTSDYLAFFGSYLGNYYLIMFFPEVWQYELFETYMPKSSWNVTDKIQFMTDYENYKGRKDYAHECAGGYYSVRLAILEKLKSMKRQASVLALRFITGEYAVPLGVWVTREATRKALASRPIEFSSRELMLRYAKALVNKKYGYDVDNLLRESKLLKNMKFQKKLSNFA